MSEDSNYGASGAGASLTLFPVTVAAVYAFAEFGTVLSAITALLGGAEGFALAVTTALWILGAATWSLYAAAAILVVFALLVAVVKQSVPAALIGVLGVVLAGILYALATIVFGAFPFIVGLVFGFYTVTLVVGVAAVLILGGLGLLLLL